MGRKAVAQHVGGDAFAQAAALPSFTAGGSHGSGSQMQVRPPGGKQPGADGAQQAKVGAEDFQQARREHRVAILATLAMLDADEHALAVTPSKARPTQKAFPR